MLNIQSKLDSHPLILGRPWLAIADAYIECRSRNMLLSNGSSNKILVLYPPSRPILVACLKEAPKECPLWANYEEEYEDVRLVLTIGKALRFHNEIKDETINTFINQPRNFWQQSWIVTTKNGITPETEAEIIPTTIVHNSISIEIDTDKALNINPNLSPTQINQLLQILQIEKESFAWDYTVIKGISPDLCTHHIYIKEDNHPVCQLQRRMNPLLKDIVTEELQKLLDVNFIYPISDSQWVSPLVIVPKKNGKWGIYVDYRELNKSMQKDHFTLPFIDQVLDTIKEENFLIS